MTTCCSERFSQNCSKLSIESRRLQQMSIWVHCYSHSHSSLAKFQLPFIWNNSTIITLCCVFPFLFFMNLKKLSNSMNLQYNYNRKTWKKDGICYVWIWCIFLSWFVQAIIRREFVDELRDWVSNESDSIEPKKHLNLFDSLHIFKKCVLIRAFGNGIFISNPPKLFPFILKWQEKHF